MEDTVIKEVIKKSELVAKDAYEYQWITYPEYGFLQSHIEEKTEELEITYDLENRRSFTEIRKEDLPDILLVLDDIGNLKKYLASIVPPLSISHNQSPRKNSFCYHYASHGTLPRPMLRQGLLTSFLKAESHSKARLPYSQNESAQTA